MASRDAMLSRRGERDSKLYIGVTSPEVTLILVLYGHPYVTGNSRNDRRGKGHPCVDDYYKKVLAVTVQGHPDNNRDNS